MFKRHYLKKHSGMPPVSVFSNPETGTAFPRPEPIKTIETKELELLKMQIKLVLYQIEEDLHPALPGE